MKKILIVVNSAKFFISHRLPLATTAQEKGFQVELAFPEIQKKHKKLLELKKLKTNYIPLSRAGRNIFRELQTIFYLFHLFLKLKPDVVHLITIKPVLYGGFISKILKVPTLIAISGMGYMYGKDGSKLLRFFSDIAYRLILTNKSLRIVVQNTNDEEVLTSIKKVNKKYISLLPGSGVNLEEFRYSLPNLEEIIFVMPCRMLWEKGVKEYVQAAEKIKSKYPEVKFILSGPHEDSNPSSVPKEYLDRLNEKNLVHWLGETSDMPSLYKSASVVIVPSYYNEGLPKVLLEAAASGRPAITTDMPGCGDAVENNKTGLVIPIQDSDALFEAMEKLILDKALILKMGQSARIKAEQEFDIKYVITEHINIYKDLSKFQNQNEQY